MTQVEGTYQINAGQSLITLEPRTPNYDGHSDMESSPVVGTKTCWWNGSGMVQYPTVQGSTLTVGQRRAQPIRRRHVGFGYGVINLIQTLGAAPAAKFPCTVSSLKGNPLQAGFYSGRRVKSIIWLLPALRLKGELGVVVTSAGYPLTARLSA
jgi:hypothetical protein